VTFRFGFLMPDPVANWLKRHRNRTNFWLHMAGIPACFVAAPIALAMRQWLVAAGLFAGGYVLQFVGHLVEQNRSGEQELLEKAIVIARRALRRRGQRRADS